MIKVINELNWITCEKIQGMSSERTCVQRSLKVCTSNVRTKPSHTSHFVYDGICVLLWFWSHSKWEYWYGKTNIINDCCTCRFKNKFVFYLLREVLLRVNVGYKLVFYIHVIFFVLKDKENVIYINIYIYNKKYKLNIIIFLLFN